MDSILVLGDSHIKHFKNKFIKNYRLDVVRAGGASAQGLLNIKSKRKALNKITKFINTNTINHKYVILCFGEVDCNATIWYYKEKYNQTLDEALKRSINNYIKFIEKYIHPHFNNNQIIIFDPILPTVRDEYPQTFEVRKDLNTTQKQRTDLTDKFSKNLRLLSNNNGYKFLSLNNIIRDTRSGLIDKKYIKNPLDHHLPKKVSFELWSTQLESLL